MSAIVAPSVLAADFGNLEREIKMLNESSADWIHVDIMDGVFVPNISFGFPVMEVIKKHATKPLDVHLMITQPERYIDDFRKAGADHIYVHIEGSLHLHRTIQHIKAVGCKAGVAVNPHTPVSFLREIIADIDLICLMSVNPGFGGQKFIENTYTKVRELKVLIQERKSNALIEIDGGVNTENAALLAAAGADAFVAGSFVFSSANPKETIQRLKDIKK